MDWHNIIVNSKGENTIVITPGANARVDEKYVEDMLDQLKEFKILLLQFEIPLSSIHFLLINLPTNRPMIILDPAPAKDLTGLFTQRVDILTPNIRELETLTEVALVGKASIKKASLNLMQKETPEKLS